MKRRKVSHAEPPKGPEEDRSISMAITLKGSVITEAILHGYKASAFLLQEYK